MSENATTKTPEQPRAYWAWDYAFLALTLGYAGINIYCLAQTAEDKSAANPVLMLCINTSFFLVAVANYWVHVKRTYWRCFNSAGADPKTDYERENYENGTKGIRKPHPASFYARAAWKAGRDRAKAAA